MHLWLNTSERVLLYHQGCVWSCTLLPFLNLDVILFCSTVEAWCVTGWLTVCWSDLSFQGVLDLLLWVQTKRPAHCYLLTTTILILTWLWWQCVSLLMVTCLAWTYNRPVHTHTHTVKKVKSPHGYLKALNTVLPEYSATLWVYTVQEFPVF